MKKKILIIGSGNVGRTLARSLKAEGYEVSVGIRNIESENVSKLRIENLGVEVGCTKDLIAKADIIALAITSDNIGELIESVGKEKFAGKILWDLTNPFRYSKSSNGVFEFFTPANDSLGEILQRSLPDTKVVKALNYVGFGIMYKPNFSEKGTVLIAGNDEDAKKEVSEIIKTFDWDTENAGKIESSRALEQMCQQYVCQGLFLNNWNFTFKILKK